MEERRHTTQWLEASCIFVGPKSARWAPGRQKGTTNNPGSKRSPLDKQSFDNPVDDCIRRRKVRGPGARSPDTPQWAPRPATPDSPHHAPWSANTLGRRRGESGILAAIRQERATPGSELGEELERTTSNVMRHVGVSAQAGGCPWGSRPESSIVDRFGEVNYVVNHPSAPIVLPHPKFR